MNAVGDCLSIGAAPHSYAAGPILRAVLRECGRCDCTEPQKIGGLQKFLCYEACQVISNIFAYKLAHLDVERDSDHLSI